MRRDQLARAIMHFANVPTIPLATTARGHSECVLDLVFCDIISPYATRLLQPPPIRLTSVVLGRVWANCCLRDPATVRIDHVIALFNFIRECYVAAPQTIPIPF